MRLLHATTVLLSCAFLAACSSGISLDEPIEGPTWQLEQLGGVLIEPSSDPRENAQIRFDRDGRVSGTGGCNRITGTFERNGSRLRLAQLGTTRRACANPAVEINESQFFAALNATTSYRLPNPGRLALLDSTGRTIATLSRGYAP